MTAEIISVGTELLLGNILNTNAQYLSRELAALGITVQRESTIGDNHGRLADFVNEAKSRCDLLVFTGGLGPTADDLTKETVAACFGDELMMSGDQHRLFVTLGQFSIIRLERDTQLLIPAYDYCVPEKECAGGRCNDDPCEIFSQIRFPVEEFFPTGECTTTS